MDKWYLFFFFSLCWYCIWECSIELCVIYSCWETLNWENDFITIVKRVTSGIKCIWCIVWLEDACAKNELIRCDKISCSCLIESERLWIWSCWYILNCPTEVLKLWITKCSVINSYLEPDCCKNERIVQRLERGRWLHLFADMLRLGRWIELLFDVCFQFCALFFLHMFFFMALWCGW